MGPANGTSEIEPSAAIVAFVAGVAVSSLLLLVAPPFDYLSILVAACLGAIFGVVALRRSPAAARWFVGGLLFGSALVLLWVVVLIAGLALTWDGD